MTAFLRQRSTGNTVRLWDVNSGRAVRDLRGSSREFMYAAFSPNGRWLATGGDARTIEVWDLVTGKVSRTLKGHKQDVCAVAFSPDGRWLASASKDRTVKLWELSTGREVHTLAGHQDSVTSLGVQSEQQMAGDQRLGQDREDLGCRDRAPGSDTYGIPSPDLCSCVRFPWRVACHRQR